MSAQANTLRFHSVPILMMLIDAFSASYLTPEDAPYLCNLSNESKIFLEPMFAFRGIEATVFTGLSMKQHGIWTEFRLRRGKLASPLLVSIAKDLVRVADFLPHDKGKKAVRYVLQKHLLKEKRPSFHLIPPSYFEYFEPSMTRAISEPCSLGQTLTLFDIMRRNNISFGRFTREDFGSDKEVFEQVARLLKGESIPEFLFVKLGDLDSLGHTFGPRSPETKRHVRLTDKMVKRIVETCHSHDSDVEFLIFSDHGMSRVIGECDLFGVLKNEKNNRAIRKDCFFFLDSTMARFWYNRHSIREEIEEGLRKISFGHLLEKNEREEHHLPEGRAYGDLIFVLDEGHIFNPSFWHVTQRVRGMHGYEVTKTTEGLPIAVMSEGALARLPEKRRLSFADLFALVSRFLDQL